MFNLLNEVEVSNYYNKSNLFPKDIDLNKTLYLLDIFKILNVSSKCFWVDDKGFVTFEAEGFRRKISVKSIINLAEKLNVIKYFKGFSTLTIGLNNPTQFFDTIFEIDCMHFIAEQSGVIELELSPEVKINNGVKRPDFRFLIKNNMEFFCECKSIVSVNRIKKSRIIKLVDKLLPEFSGFINEKFRIEIAFKTLPPHWNRNYSKQLVAAVKTLMEKEFMKPISISVYFSEFDQAFQFNRRVFTKLCESVHQTVSVINYLSSRFNRPSK